MLFPENLKISSLLFSRILAPNLLVPAPILHPRDRSALLPFSSLLMSIVSLKRRSLSVSDLLLDLVRPLAKLRMGNQNVRETILEDALLLVGDGMD